MCTKFLETNLIVLSEVQVLLQIIALKLPVISPPLHSIDALYPVPIYTRLGTANREFEI